VDLPLSSSRVSPAAAVSLSSSASAHRLNVGPARPRLCQFGSLCERCRRVKFEIVALGLPTNRPCTLDRVPHAVFSFFGAGAQSTPYFTNSRKGRRGDYYE